jgi:hypothetical protein
MGIPSVGSLGIKLAASLAKPGIKRGHFLPGLQE